MAPVVVLLTLLVAAACGLPRAANDDDKYKLPEGFLLGAGTSAYQTEGAWDEDGKGVNVLDHYYHSHNTAKNLTGDVAADSYHRYKEDIGIAADLGFNVFRFSISWTRLLPDGRTSNVNAKGVQHYHDLLAELKAEKIEPLITMCHFDYPQVFEDEFGGWLGDEMPDVFAEYADFVFNEFGSEVKYWLTLNEPAFYCTRLSKTKFVPPFSFDTTERQNACIKNSILAHAKAHKIYEEKYKAKFKGLVGFSSGPIFFRSASDAPEDIAATEAANSNTGIGLTVDPLVFGDYPEGVRTTQKAFTEEEKLLIKGRIDFVGINIYGGKNTSASDDGGGGGGNSPDGMGGPEDAWVLRQMPLWIKNRYDSVKELPVFITENGAKSTGPALQDWDSRAVYCSAFLRELVAGIHEDQTRVFGYTVWSFVDTFEYRNGFLNWGLIHVDFASGSLNRTLKASSTFFKTATRTGFVPLVEEGSRPFPDPDAPSGAASFSSTSIITTLAAFAALTRLQ
ncbi:myrosinase 1-like [Thrips palmi]|uniref:Myrosinase 1-like n=1 Tax=Thrips palmi TaxID=161013 RepID=A0A6P8Z6S7_THRPL|nr:myrosinase 1-like [Thrips palmi]